MGLKEGSVYPKVALVVTIIAFLLFLISFGAPHWAKSNPYAAQKSTEHIGLWKFCTYPFNGAETCTDFIDLIVGDWIKAAQSFMTLGFFGFLACIGTVAAYTFMGQAGDIGPKILYAALGALGGTGLFLFIGVTTFAAKYTEHWVRNHEGLGPESCMLSWAFGVAATSCAFVFLSLGLLVADMIFGRNEDSY